MCEIKDGFKLCTCGPINESEADWILYRGKSGKWMGIYLPHTAVDAKKEEPQKDVFKENFSLITKALNSRNVFDFDYKPQSGDLLYFKKEIIGRSPFGFVFRFYQGNWEYDERRLFEYRQLVSGKVK